LDQRALARPRGTPFPSLAALLRPVATLLAALRLLLQATLQAASLL
jgi:hypothetical protein